jgi:DNA-binding XRE family transcriptional regulator
MTMKTTLREARTRAGMSQRELARKIGANRLTILNAENGTDCSKMWLGTAFLLSQALQVPVEQLFVMED